MSGLSFVALEPNASVPLAQLPALSIAALPYYNRLRQGLTLEWQQQSLHLSLCVPLSPEAGSLTLALQVGDEAVQLSVPPLLLEAFSRWPQQPGLAQCLSKADPQQRDVLLDYALGPWLQWLEQALEVPVVLAEQASEAAVAVALNIQLGGAPGQTLGLLLSPRLCEQLACRWESAAPAPVAGLERLNLTLTLQAGWQRLPTAQFRQLAVGDIVMLDRPAPPATARLALRGRPLAFAVHARELAQLQLSSDLNLQPLRNTVMDNPEIEALAVNLVCEVGRLEVPLGQLRQLSKGSVLAMPEPEGAEVAVMVDGQPFARGELVRLGDGLGVRLLSLAHDE